MIGTIPHARKRTVGKKTYYFASITSDKLKGITFVPVIESSKRTYLMENPTDGYQRPGSRTRMRKFRDYLLKHDSAIIPPVLLSSRSDWRFVPNSGNGLLGNLEIDGPAAIVDGQHRVGGYICLFEENEVIRDVDFIVIEDLSVDEERQEFLDVNNNQVGVSKALTTFLEGEEAGVIAWAMNTDDDSLFKGRIYRTTNERTNLFALHSVAKNVDRTFDHGKLRDLLLDQKLEIFKRYWQVIADALPDEWDDINKLDDTTTRGRSDFKYKLLELTGLIAWSIIAPEILSRCYHQDLKTVDWEGVRKLVESCGNVDWEKEGQYKGRTGEVGGKEIAVDMERKIPADHATTDQQNEDEV
jgi:DNA sulfur modification protein DndB